MKKLLRKYQDPKLAAIAYNWGPGNVKKWLASDKKLPVPAETRQYASHFAKGGIAHFYAGGNQNLGLSPGESVVNPITMSDFNSTYEDEDKYRSLTPQAADAPNPVNAHNHLSRVAWSYIAAIREAISGESLPV